jgi:hypothetical protein
MLTRAFIETERREADDEIKIDPKAIGNEIRIDVNDLLTLITNAIFACLLRNSTTMPSSNGIKPLPLDDDDDDLR